jgi:hypothetical protein
VLEKTLEEDDESRMMYKVLPTGSIILTVDKALLKAVLHVRFKALSEYEKSWETIGPLTQSLAGLLVPYIMSSHCVV